MKKKQEKIKTNSFKECCKILGFKEYKNEVYSVVLDDKNKKTKIIITYF